MSTKQFKEWLLLIVSLEQRLYTSSKTQEALLGECIVLGLAIVLGLEEV